MRLLIVEDDADLRNALAGALRPMDFEIDEVADGPTAFTTLMSREYDLAIVDLGLPGMDGMNLIRSLRRKSRGVPVLIITARDALEDRISGLDAGADDYLTKPFELAELEARVRALLRRSRMDRNAEIVIGELTFTPGQPCVRLGNTSVDLSVGEFALLEVLAMRCGRVVRRDEIADRLSRGRDPVSDTAIEVAVHRLRKRLGPHGLKVRTLRGFGYLMEQGEASDGD